jgi:demethylmenaquinone methyltransferase / 2-methoxy-6-polyprenyl-1,4-benzoquinol methylase
VKEITKSDNIWETPMKNEQVLPAPEEKHAYVQEMFNDIAPRYDLLNSLMSLRLHYLWRKIATQQAGLKPGDTALDVCTGTGDFAFELAQRVGSAGTVHATDFSEQMLVYGRQKAMQKAIRQNVERDIRSVADVQFQQADTQNLPFEDNRFDAVTVGFGIRNVADIPKGIAEMTRVAKPGGRVVILEFSTPQNPLFARLYHFYSYTLIPTLGGLIAGSKRAYTYLPSSIEKFYSRDALKQLMQDAGLSDVKIQNLLFGAVVIHSGVKVNEVKKNNV